MPRVGDLVMWCFPDDPIFCHHIYEDFPVGRRIRAWEAFVDFDRPVRVEEVAECFVEKRRTAGTPGIIHYVAIRFATLNGTVAWTNFSKGGSPWMSILTEV